MVFFAPVQKGCHFNVFLGLGSNLGDREGYLERAVQLLAGTGNTDILRCSSIYESEPWGIRGQEPFLNYAVEIITELGPAELLAACKKIEAGLGRAGGPRWGPRVVDIDILLFCRRMIEAAGLIVPHPRLAERRFALIPLAELAGNMAVPGTGRTVQGLLGACPDQSAVRLFRRAKGVLE
jgi:2-amino-4-hydroxy-6-hydroxymethyldihydropteridine diphosphokinase